MRITFHGGAMEVGRSCIQINSDSGKRYLLDVGIKFKEDGFMFPEGVLDISKVDGVFLSHAHLDHSGGLPLFEHKDLRGPIFCTPQTLSISKILLRDSYKVARIRNMHPAYNNVDLKEVQKDSSLVSFDHWYTHKDVRFKFFNAGHVPGSAMILLEVDGKRILYTGDFNMAKTSLMVNAEVLDEMKNVDILICESTYGDKELPERAPLEKKFVASIEKTIKEGGSVLIPVFSLGRSQEVLLMLSKKRWPVKIYYDGMCNKLTRKILGTSSKYVKNKDDLHHMFYDVVEWVNSPRRRKHAVAKQGIFVTTSGMLQGGPVLSYLGELWHNPKNKVALMGFQCKRTNGRHLLEDGWIYLDGWKTYVKCKVEKYDFSGHSDREDIQKLVSAINPKHVFFQHGDAEGVAALAKWASKAINGKVYAPKVGDSFSF